MRTWSFAKGHGTLNDFVLIKDRSGLLNPSVEDVRFLCDRRRGVGADGFLRAVRAEKMPGWDGPSGVWFMDYRNADGSYAQMCGNGLRVFVQWLVEEDLAAGDPIRIATRAGLRLAHVKHDGRVSVTMGTPVWSTTVGGVRVGGQQWFGHVVDVGNPHCVVHLTSEEELAALDLDQPIAADPDVFPDGANVEFVVDRGPDHLGMRVYERWVGETMSCGMGVVAACCDDRGLRAVTANRDSGQTDRLGASSQSGRLGETDRPAVSRPGRDDYSERLYHVDVPGGTLKVTFNGAGEASLTGPATIVARGEVSLPDV
ncbi:MAG: diaminopimelate epimerase [Propionibacteriaceae bacterium]|jgi:diaminopimelate epimerase|nr:diaminopimelate epimerase [Propionibacteriaceae bacterium]